MPAGEKRLYNSGDGAVAELADAADLKSAGRDTVRVRPPLAPQDMAIEGKFRRKSLYIGVYGTHKRSVPYAFKEQQRADSFNFFGR
jgi:hypothetical protein